MSEREFIADHCNFKMIAIKGLVDAGVYNTD